jgi:hypothetical protein
MQPISIAAVVGTTEFDEDARSLMAGVGEDWRVARFRASPAGDLCRQVAHEIQMAGCRLDVLEIIAHASPTWIAGIQIDEVSEIGSLLRDVFGVHSGTRLYLSGCNTACTGLGRNLAQAFASHSGLTTHGAVGFLEGYYALNTEVCRATENGAGGFPNCSRDANGRACWQRFDPAVSVTLPPSPRLLDSALRRAVELIKTAERVVPPLNRRIGPDAVFEVADGVEPPITYEVLGGGAFLRERLSGVTRLLPPSSGAQLLEVLLPRSY